MEKTRTNVAGATFLFTELEVDQLFTPEDFTDEHKMIASTAKQFIEKEVDPYNEAIENQDFNRVVRLLHKAGDLGLLAHSIPEAYGGLGLDKISKGLVGEVIGRAGGYGVAHSNHTCIATLPITYFGTPEQKAKYLPKLASGEYLGAYCLTEPGSGSDALAAKTTARLNEEGTHYLLNGTKLYITNAVFSDTFIVYAKVDGTKFTAFIVEKDFPGLSLGPEEKKMGIKGSSTRSVIFEDCIVPVDNLLGEVGKGHVIALNVLNLGRFNLGSACMGAGKYGLHLALKFTNERIQFGKAIAEFGATKEKIAKMASRIYAAESIQYRTAHLIEDALGDLYDSTDLELVGKRMMEYATECAICKVYGSETLDQVADEALQLHGGAGFIKEYRVEQMYRDSRINRIFEGTNEINRLLIPTHLFRKAVKGEIHLEEVVQKAVLELQEPKTNFDGPLARELEAVASIRRIFLLCAGVVYEAYGASLQDEQEALMKLADIAINLFAAESVVLRSLKAINKNGLEKEVFKEKLAIAFINDVVLEVEVSARKLVTTAIEGVKLQQTIGLIIKNLSRFQNEGAAKYNREIAEVLAQTELYTN
ncbi:acyl-CoA dehydrogenase family protein [Cytobacillus sp. S13-E01]|uniref:acyl-CoA dehydrogenase family protein n=1 Tax=Cytobacillus sp. S13-E01 TaxID=3031326 RepID=UPI0023D8A3FC|nr:acyl-CoA dehydrogenase family protein [Cytobacillus sp. S13-E01]MDF0725419.1 acyl-CoA dehydrogenase family protein [Cytobacillus sp. S13-E01]